MDITRIRRFTIICLASIAAFSCNEGTIPNNKNGSNHYAFYPKGQLKSIIVNSANQRDSFHFTQDGSLRNWGKLFRVAYKDSILINKQLPIMFNTAMFRGVILHLQIHITDSLKNAVWDTTIERTARHSIEGFYVKKQLSIPGQYRYKVLANYFDSATKKVVISDTATADIIVFEKNK